MRVTRISDFASLQTFSPNAFQVSRTGPPHPAGELAADAAADQQQAARGELAACEERENLLWLSLE
jgi:hypothetical protein